jgi:outer membrane protein TolC
MEKKRLAAFLVLLFVAPALMAQTRLTLADAVATALEKNPVRKAAAFEQQAAAAGVRESRAALLPQVWFTETYQRGNDPVFVFGSKLRQQRFGAADFGLNVLNTPTPFTNFATRLSGGWRLFDSGVSWLRLSQAKQMSSLAQRQLDRTEQQLVYRVVDAYLNLLLAEKRLQVAEDARKTSQAILERSQSRFDAGMVVESDPLGARVQHAQRQQELIQARNGVELARARLNHELGVALDSSYQPAEVLAEQALPVPSEEESEKLALERRPDLAGMQLQVEIQRKSVTAAKAAFGPQLNAFAGWEAANPHFTGGGGNNWTAGFELKMDLFSGGAKRARLQRERATASQAAAQRDSMLSGVRLEVRQAHLDVEAAQQQIDVARGAVTESKESLRISQNRYQGGLITLSDLLRDEEAALRAETGYWQAVYRLRISHANLELAMGTLDANSPVVKP